MSGPDPTQTPAPADMTEQTLPDPAATAPTDPALTGEAGTAPTAVATPSSTDTSTQETEPETEPDLPVEYQDPRLAYQEPRATGTDEDLLTGPPDGAQLTPYDATPDVPAQAQHWLPALQTAASAPGAPAEFQNMLKLVVANINQNNGG